MNRSIALLLVFLPLLGACSSSSTPPATPAGDSTSSPSSSAAPDTSGAPAAASASPSAEPSAAPTTGTKTIMSTTPGLIPSATPDTPLSDQPVPPLSKTQKGLLHQQLAGTEVVFITVVDASATCATDLKAAAKGDRRIELQTPWKPGFYTMTSRNAHVRFDQYTGSTWQKAEASGDGGIQVRTAPTAQGGTGRIHVQAKRGGDSVDAELEVAVCVPVDLTKKPKK